LAFFASEARVTRHATVVRRQTVTHATACRQTQRELAPTGIRCPTPPELVAQ
jgi:hypothetical protein